MERRGIKIISVVAMPHNGRYCLVCWGIWKTTVQPSCKFKIENMKHSTLSSSPNSGNTNVISRFLMFLHLKRYPHKLSKKNKLLNRKINYETYCWGDYKRGIFSERLQVLIDNCKTYQQYYRCQAMLKGYIKKYGQYENDGWIFFGNRISIVVRALEVQVKGIEKAIGRITEAVG